MNLSEKLKKFRKDNNMTQQDLADKLFVSRSLVSKWEQGNGVPTVDVIEKLALLMDVPFEEVIGEKEMQVCAIENNETIKSHKKVTVIFIVITTILLIVIVGLMLGIYLSKKDKDEKNDDVGSYQQAFYEIVQEQIFMFAERENDKLIIENKSDSIEFIKELDVNEPNEIIVKDKYNKIISLGDIQSGYKLSVKFSYFQDRSIYKFPKKFNKITEIAVIEDYVTGQEYVQGFFLSTTVYEGESVPINGFGFTNSLADFEKYPYILMRSYYTGKGFFEYKSEEVYRQSICNQVVKEKATVGVRLANTVERVYVYAVKNENNGYYLYDTITKDKPSVKLMTKYITDIYVNDEKTSHSTDVEVEINADFVNAPIEIMEFDVNHVCINRIPFGERYLIMLNEKTRYIQLLYEDGRFSTFYAPGEEIFTIRILETGFVQDFYLSTY